MRWPVVFVLGTSVMTLVTACGGRVGGDGEDGGHSSSDGGAARASDGGSTWGFDGNFPVCPSEPPIVGSACDSPNLGCAYVSGPSCTAFVCSNGQWQTATMGGC